MTKITTNNYQFDNCININDSQIYYDIASAINQNASNNINSASDYLVSAKSNIDYDGINSAHLSSKISSLNNIKTMCGNLSSRIITGVKIYEEYDSSLKDLLDSYLISGLFKGKLIHFNEDGTVKEMNTDELFQFLNNNQKGYCYGVNQSPFGDIQKNDPEYYEYIRKIMKEKYGFNDSDIDFFMKKIDDNGNCAYARSTNDVILAYKDRPDLFLETFGYPLYIKNSEGKMILNATELFIDYLITSYCDCDKVNIVNMVDGKYVIDREGSLYGDYVAAVEGESARFFDVKTKNTNFPIKCTVEEICNDSMNLDKESLKKLLKEEFKKNDGLSMGMCPLGKGHYSTGGPLSVPYYSTETNIVYQMDGPHWITITELTEDGVIIDSWGERMLVKYDDLINDSYFNIFCTNFEAQSKK